MMFVHKTIKDDGANREAFVIYLAANSDAQKEERTIALHLPPP